MKIQRRSKKFLIVSTAITIIALTSVLTVSAAVLLGTIHGGDVTVAGVASGTITYATTPDGSEGWNPTLSVTTGSWYAKLHVNAGYNGPVTITWQLESYSSGDWVVEATPVTTTFSLTGAAVDIYATDDGTNSGNYDWKTVATDSATYRVTVQIESVSAP